MVNPETNRLERLGELDEEGKVRISDYIENLRHGAVVEKFVPTLVRPDGSPVPKTWSTFAVGEKVVIKDYTFEVAYIGETSILFEPVGPIEIGKDGK